MESNLFFNSITKHLKAQKPLVVYRKPGQSLVTAQLQQKLAKQTFKRHQQEGFIFAPFYKDEASYFFSIRDAEILKLTSFDKSSIDYVEPTVLPVEQELLFQKQQHIKLVSAAIDEIKQGGCQKIVVSRIAKYAAKGEALTYFKRLLYKYDSAFVYMWYHPDEGLWLGATPEVLVRTHRNKLKTMALAGTQSANETQTTFVWGEKEKKEQAFVTSFIKDNLNTIDGVEQIEISNLKTQVAGKVAHLKTDISAKFNPEKMKEIIKQLHPTPAVCGTPKDEASCFLAENENYKRSYYAGYLGEINKPVTQDRNPRKRNVENSAFRSLSKETDLYVNLRCMKLNEGCVHLYLGGGITDESVPEMEWEETLKKASTLASIL
ncbi:chorismate-binding protein [Mesonia sp. HuA40]|uniref:chorismate-binding protein n=1 Tax=Mesonia sp. HuA40 TaxID=2602761 RepID=UPI0011CBE1AE|nr:chorismate-binding protein [Mesonia sp. HuA40]TXK71125.1 isochorismate synthase [Mesonia sp. HuA40]